MTLKYILTSAVLTLGIFASAQDENAIKDSLYIHEVEQDFKSEKVLHAEPLYIDLIRDLGARKGEKEWNIGLGLTDNLKFDSYDALIEYEWAPIDRLGLEVELPFTFYSPLQDNHKDSIPYHGLNSLKMATQWSFFVSSRTSTSMAVGYIHEFELPDFKSLNNIHFSGNVYNPFLVVAKRWGSNFHTLIYTGPMFKHHFKTGELHTTFDVNSNFHYMIPGTRNFLGLEFNKVFSEHHYDMTIRPQMRVGVSDQIMIGIVAGIPVNRTNERISSFIRLIWEPKHKAH